MHKILNNMLTDELKFQERRKEGRDDVEVMAPDSNTTQCTSTNLYNH